MSRLFGGRVLQSLFSSGSKTYNAKTLTPDMFQDGLAPEDLNNLLTASIDSKNDNYIISSLNLLMKLLQTSENSQNVAESLGDLGVCSSIEQLLGYKSSDPSVHLMSLQFLYILIKNTDQTSEAQNQTSSALSLIYPWKSSNNLKKLSNSTSLFRIVKLGQTYADKEHFVKIIFDILLVFAYDSSLLGKLISCGMIDFLFLIMNTKSLIMNTHNRIITTMCQIIYTMISNDLDEYSGNNACQEKFTESPQIYHTLLTILTTQHVPNDQNQLSMVHDKSTIIWILNVLSILVKSNDSNKHKLSESQACQIIPLLGNSSFQYIEDSALASTLCQCIANLSFPNLENQIELGKSDATGLIIRTLKYFLQHLQSTESSKENPTQNVIEDALRTLHYLCKNCDENLSILAQENIIQLFQEILKKYELNADILQWLMFAMDSFAEYEPSIPFLGTSEMIEDFGLLLQRHRSNVDLIQWTSLLLAKLSNQKEFADNLYRANVCQLLMDALILHVEKPDTLDVIEELFHVISVLGQSSELCRQFFIEQRLTDIVLSSLSYYEDQEIILEYLFSCLTNLFYFVNQLLPTSSTSTISPEISAVASPHTIVYQTMLFKQLYLYTEYIHVISRCYETESKWVTTLTKIITKYQANEYIVSYGLLTLASYHMGFQILFSLSYPYTLQTTEDIFKITDPKYISVASNSHRMYSMCKYFTAFTHASIPLKQIQDHLVISLHTIPLISNILSNYFQNIHIVYYNLLALLHQITYHEELISACKTSNICATLSKILNYYYPYSNTNKYHQYIVLVLVQCILQLSIDPACREILGSTLVSLSGNGTHGLLSTIVHNMQNKDIVQAGVEAASALIISPMEDSLSIITTPTGKGSTTEANTPTASNHVSFSNTTSGNNNHDDDQGLKRKQSYRLSVRKSWSSTLSQAIKPFADPSLDTISATDEPQDESTQEPSEVEVVSNNSTSTSTTMKNSAASAFRRLSSLGNIITLPKLRSTTNANDNEPIKPLIDIQGPSLIHPSLYTMKKSLNQLRNIYPIQANNNILLDAANNILSTGLSDQDEKRNQANKLQKTMRKNNAMLLYEQGYLSVCMVILQTYKHDSHILLMTMNSFHSFIQHLDIRHRLLQHEIIDVLLNLFSDIVDQVFAFPDSKQSKEGAEESQSTEAFNSSSPIYYLLLIEMILIFGTFCLEYPRDYDITNYGYKSTLVASEIQLQFQQRFAQNPILFSKLISILYLVFHPNSSIQLPETIINLDELFYESIFRTFYLLIVNNTSNQEILCAQGSELIPRLAALVPSGGNVSDSDSELASVTNPDQLDLSLTLDDKTNNQLPFHISSLNELFILIYREFFFHRHIIYYTSLTISSLCYENPEFSENILQLNGCELILQTFSYYLTMLTNNNNVNAQLNATIVEANEEIIQVCCYAVYALKYCNEYLGQHKACEYVLQSLMVYSHHALIAEFSCRAIGSLAELDDNKIILAKLQVVKYIIQTLNKHIGNDSFLSFASSFVPMTSSAPTQTPLTSVNSTSALGLLSMPSTTGGVLQTTFTTTTTTTSTSAQISTVNTITNSANVARWGCTAIYYLAKGYQADYYQEQLISNGVCELIAKALMKYSEYDMVISAGCRALVVLLINNEPYKQKLGALGVCGGIVEALQLFPSSIPVAKWGCRAVAVLAESHESNISKLANAGACETIPLIIQSHPNNEHIASAGCDVISFMTEHIENGFASRFGHGGACEAVVGILRKHGHIPLVAARGSIALASLARVQGNARWFGPAGACEVLCNTLSIHYQNLAVAKYIISAIGNLCVIEHNKERLGSYGICEMIVQTMKLHILDSETSKTSAAAVYKLCEAITYGNSTSKTIESAPSPMNSSSQNTFNIQYTPSPDIQLNQHAQAGRYNRAALFVAGVCPVLIEILSYHLTNPQVAQAICHAISTLTSGQICEQERNAFGQLDTCSLLVKTIEFHEGNDEITRWCCYAIRSLAYHSYLNQTSFEKLNIPRVLVPLVRKYRSPPVNSSSTNHLVLLEAIISAIHHLSQSNPTIQTLFGENLVCESLLEIIELHLRQTDLMLLTCKTLFVLCDGHEINRIKISFGGAPDFLYQILNRYLDQEAFVAYVLSIMIGISLDKVGKSRLGTVGMTKFIFQVISKYEKTSEYILLLSIVLLGNMAHQSSPNQQTLAQNGAIKFLSVHLQKYNQNKYFQYLTYLEGYGSLHGSSPSSTLSLSPTPSLQDMQSKPLLKQESAEELSNDIELVNHQTTTLEITSNVRVSETSLSALLGEISLLKEINRAIYYLSFENPVNQNKFQASGVLEILANVLSNPILNQTLDSLKSNETTFSIERQTLFLEQLKSSTKLAMDLLMDTAIINSK